MLPVREAGQARKRTEAVVVPGVLGAVDEGEPESIPGPAGVEAAGMERGSDSEPILKVPRGTFPTG